MLDLGYNIRVLIRGINITIRNSLQPAFVR